MEEKKKLEFHCLFCFSTQFILPDIDYVPSSSDLIQCANCGRLNDFDSMMRVVKRKGIEWAEEQANEMIEKYAKKLKRMFG